MVLLVYWDGVRFPAVSCYFFGINMEDYIITVSGNSV